MYFSLPHQMIRSSVLPPGGILCWVSGCWLVDSWSVVWGLEFFSVKTLLPFKTPFDQMRKYSVGWEKIMGILKFLCWPRLRHLIFLTHSDNLLNKHLLLLMTLCVISVPGTGEMLEIQIKRPGPVFVGFSDKWVNWHTNTWYVVNRRCFGSWGKKANSLYR